MNTPINTSVVFYESFMLAANAAPLTPAQRCEFYEGLMRYCFYGEQPVFENATMAALFFALKVNLDNSMEKMERHRKLIANAKRGGAPRGNSNATKKVYDGAKTTNETTNKTTNETTNETTISNSLSNSNSSSNSNSNSNSDSNSKTNSKSVSVSVCVCKENKEREHTQTHTNTQTDTNTPVFEIIEFDQESIRERNQAFYRSLVPYVEKYGAPRIQKFYDYWSELTADRQHMRFEEQSSWVLESRLARWKD